MMDSLMMSSDQTNGPWNELMDLVSECDLTLTTAFPDVLSETLVSDLCRSSKMYKERKLRYCEMLSELENSANAIQRRCTELKDEIARTKSETAEAHAALEEAHSEIAKSTKEFEELQKVVDEKREKLENLRALLKCEQAKQILHRRQKFLTQLKMKKNRILVLYNEETGKAKVLQHLKDSPSLVNMNDLTDEQFIEFAKDLRISD